MNLRSLCIVVCLFLSQVPAGWAQTDPSTICRVEEGMLILTIDRRWDDRQRQQAMELFGLDSLLLAKAFEGKKEFTLDGVVWNVRLLDANRAELIKPLQTTPATPPEPGRGALPHDIIMLDDRWISPEEVNVRESAPYGVNVLTRYDVFSYYNGTARFFLPGRTSVRNVHLAGTFNDWSTLGTPMLQTDSGWVVSLKLQPGKYLYKYILDGRWSTDPYNRLKEDDTYGGFNSVIFCYNFRFDLPGFTDATQVYLSGSFNDWNPREIRMQRLKSGWAVRLFLHEGTHAYKFIVDGRWILDPACKVNRPDGSGNVNSFVSIGDTLWFRLPGYQDANYVFLAGNFNGWNPDELAMEKDRQGWRLPYVLGPGNYEYKFVVDGRWMVDPVNALTVDSGAMMNSFLPVKPNHAFELRSHTTARQVIVTGSFNNWETNNYRMIRQQDRWVFPICLKPGKYTYKFIVDGKWILDPANELWEGNEYDTGNSVLWIEP